MNTKSILIINNMLIASSVNYMCFNQSKPAILFGIIGLVIVLYRYYKVINFKKVLFLAIFNYMIILTLLYVTRLLGVLNMFYIIGLLVSINASVWLFVLANMNRYLYESLQNIFVYFLFGFYIFCLLVFIIPSKYLNYFLYPNYINGGFKEAMICLIFIIFMPSVINNAAVGLYKIKLVKSKLVTKF